MNKSINMESNGYYSLSILDKDGNIKEDKSLHNIKNTVTYQGAFLSLVGNTGYPIMFNTLYASVGTGTTERVRSSTGLGAEVAGRSDGASAVRDGNEVDNQDGTSTLTLTRTLPFSLGELVGTFSEVGLFTASGSGGTMIAGQLIKDELGNPTTITVLSDEQLVVTYTLEWIVPNTSNLIGTGTVTDANSNTYSYEVWAQPYFSDYVIGSSSEAARYLSDYSKYVFRDASGTGDYGINVNVNNAGWVDGLTHDGSGTITAVSPTFTFSPASFSAANIVFIGMFSYAPLNAGNDVVDTTNVLGGSYPSTSETPPVYIKFLDPITKTSSDSFSIQVSLTLTV